MTEEAATSPVTHASYDAVDGASMQDVLGFDYTCAGCEYNLLGLAIGSDCPECGCPVARSLSRKHLHNANRSWVRSLRNGARLLAISALLPPAFVVAIIPLSIVSAVAGIFGAIFVGLITFGSVLAVWLLYLIGWIQLTRAEPGFIGSAAHDVTRGKCRTWSIIVALVLPAAYIVSIVSFGMSASQAVMSGVYAGPNMLMMILLAFIGPLVMITQFHYASRRIRYLGDRMSSTGIATFARVIFWVLVISGVLGILQSVVQASTTQAMMRNIQTTSTTTTGATTSTMAYQGYQMSALDLLNVALWGIGALLFLGLYAMYTYLTCWLWLKLSRAAKRRA